MPKLAKVEPQALSLEGAAALLAQRERELAEVREALAAEQRARKNVERWLRADLAQVEAALEEWERKAAPSERRLITVTLLLALDLATAITEANSGQPAEPAMVPRSGADAWVWPPPSAWQTFMARAYRQKPEVFATAAGVRAAFAHLAPTVARALDRVADPLLVAALAAWPNGRGQAARASKRVPTKMRAAAEVLHAIGVEARESSLTTLWSEQGAPPWRGPGSALGRFGARRRASARKP